MTKVTMEDPKGQSSVEPVPFLDIGGYERKAMTILNLGGNLRLLGETGVAKTTFVHYLVQKYGMRLYQISLNTDTTRWDLLASDILKDGNTQVREGVVKLWLRDETPGVKKVMYWDEYNYAQPSVTTLQNQLTDFRRSVWIPEEGKEYIRSDDHWFVISLNPWEKTGYSGTFSTNIAQMRRFETLRLNYLPPMDETNFLLGKALPKADPYVVKHVRKVDYEWTRKLVEFAAKTRTLYREGKLTTPVTTGNLKDYVAYYEHGLDDGEILEIVCGMYLEEEVPQVQKLWERDYGK